MSRPPRHLFTDTPDCRLDGLEKDGGDFANPVSDQFAEHAARLDRILSHVEAIPSPVAHHWLTILRSITVDRPLEGERMAEEMLRMHGRAADLYRPGTGLQSDVDDRVEKFDDEMEAVRSGLEWLGRILGQLAEYPVAA